MTSASRASSPPPVSRVGSAPVRAKTKSQQKKDRQLRAKQLEEEEKLAEDAASPSADEPVQEAILSRKKKSKKASAPPKPKITTAAASAASTRPASPVQKVEVEEEIPASPIKEVEPEVLEPPKQEEPTPVPDVPEETTPTSLLSELRNSSSLISTCLDTFFKPLAQANTTYKPSQNIAAIDLAVGRSLKRNPDVNMLPDQVRSMLLNQHALRYGGEDGRVWSRGCVTPGGAHLRHLEQELEDRYIEL